MNCNTNILGDTSLAGESQPTGGEPRVGLATGPILLSGAGVTGVCHQAQPTLWISCQITCYKEYSSLLG